MSTKNSISRLQELAGIKFNGEQFLRKFFDDELQQDIIDTVGIDKIASATNPRELYDIVEMGARNNQGLLAQFEDEFPYEYLN